jgi:hypothetical protein
MSDKTIEFLELMKIQARFLEIAAEAAKLCDGNYYARNVVTNALEKADFVQEAINDSFMEVGDERGA